VKGELNVIGSGEAGLTDDRVVEGKTLASTYKMQGLPLAFVEDQETAFL
jgi:hypothetical protein